MRGVILAGGTGSRLLPLTKVTNKHLLPVYNRPMIYYPIECLARAGITEVLLVAGGNNVGDFIRLLGDGRDFGLKQLSYTYQEGARGVAHALSLAESFADGGPICLLLGDNVLEYSIAPACENYRKQGSGARVLLARVENPSSYGVAEVNSAGQVTRIIEKPVHPPSNLAVIGVYFYDAGVFDIIRTLKPSPRGELEITDVNNVYVQRGQLQAEIIKGYYADCGENIDFYLRACNIVAERGANKDPEDANHR